LSDGFWLEVRDAVEWRYEGLIVVGGSRDGGYACWTADGCTYMAVERGFGVYGRDWKRL